MQSADCLTGPNEAQPEELRGWLAPNGARYRVSARGWDKRPIVVRYVPGLPPRCLLGFANGTPFPDTARAIGWCIADGKLRDPGSTLPWAERELVTREEVSLA